MCITYVQFVSMFHNLKATIALVIYQGPRYTN
jgi:hypothetical protein